MSTKKEDALFEEFGCDTCIEIVEVPEFLRRCQHAVSRLRSSSDWEFVHRAFECYSFADAVAGNVKDPRAIPFFKLKRFMHQSEYRFSTAWYI